MYDFIILIGNKNVITWNVGIKEDLFRRYKRDHKIFEDYESEKEKPKIYKRISSCLFVAIMTTLCR